MGLFQEIDELWARVVFKKSEEIWAGMVLEKKDGTLVELGWFHRIKIKKIEGTLV